MKYLKEYKDFYSSIKDPLEKLDEVQVELDGLEIASDQINGNYELGGIPVKPYKLYKYKSLEMAKLMVKHEHWGPWDLKPPR